jgi:hypothetical protein
MKQTVHYDVTMSVIETIVVGKRAFITPVDHPDEVNVINGEMATTSTIVGVNPNGSFETQDTFYIPV